MVEETYDHSGSVGVKVNDTRMLHGVYATAKRIANSGSDGVLTGDVNRTDVQILQGAGVQIVSDPSGTRYWLDGELPQPDRYLVPKPKSAPVRTGQFGASLETRTW